MGNSLCLISGPGTSAQTSNTTRYSIISGYYNLQTTETNSEIISRGSGFYSRLWVNVTSNTLNGNTTITFRKNAADGNQTLTISSSTTGTFSDDVNVDITANADKVCTKRVTAGSSGLIGVRALSYVFTADSNTMTILAANPGGSNTTSYTTQNATRVNQITGYWVNGTGTNSHSYHEVRVAGTLKYMMINITSNARTTTTTFRPWKNGAAANINIAVTSGQTGQLEDTSNTDSVAVDDTIVFAIITGTGTQSIAGSLMKIGYETTTSHSFNATTYFGNDTHGTSVTRYYPLNGLMDQANQTTDTYEARVSTICTAKFLGIRIPTNSITANSTCTFRKNNSDTSLAITIASGVTGWLEDTSNTVSLVMTDTVGFKMVTGGTGTSMAIKSISVYFLSYLFRDLFETYNVTDTVARAQTLTRALADTFDVTDTVQASSPISRQLDENYDVTDTITRLVTFLRTLQDTYDVTESVARALVMTRVLTDQYDVTDTISSIADHPRLLTDNYDVTETITISQILTRLLTDSYNVDDTVTRSQVLTRTLNENYDVQDNITRILTLTRQLSDNYDVTETINRLVTFTRILTDNYNVDDTVSRSQILTRSLIDTYDVTDTLQVQVNHIVNINENYDVVDTIQRAQILVREIQDSYDVQDSVTRLASLIRTLTDNYDVQDNITRALVLLRSVSDNYDVTDTINRLVSFQRLLTDTYDDVDTIVRSQILTRLLTDSYDVSDTVLAGKTFLKTLEESYDVSDTVDKLQQLTRLVTDTYNVSEDLIKQALLTRTVTDTYDVTDIVDYEISGNHIFVELEESYNVTDSVSISQILTRLLTEAYDVADTVQKIGGDVIIIDEGIKPSGGGALPYDMSRLKKRIISRTIGALLPEAFPDTIKIDNQKAWFLNDKLENEEPNKPFRQITKLNNIKATVKINNPKHITRKYNTILANVKTRKQLKLEQDVYKHIQLLEQNKITTQEFIDKIPNEIRYYNYRDGKILNYKSINNIRCGLKVNNKNRKPNNIKANLILNTSININIENKITAPLKLVYNERIQNKIVAPLQLRQISKFNTVKADLVLSNKQIHYNVFRAKVLDSKKHITKKLGTLLLRKTQLTYDVIMREILQKSKSDQKEHLLYKLQTYQTRFNVEKTKTNTEMRKLERKYKKPLMELYTKIAEEYKDDLPHFEEARIKYKKEAHDILRSVANKAYNLGIEYVSKAAQKEDIFITETDVKNVKNKTDEAIIHFFDSVEKHIKAKQYYNDVWNLKPSEQIEEQTQNMSNIPFIDLPSQEIRPAEEAQKKTEIVEQVPATEEPNKPYPIDDSVILLLNALSTGLVALGTFSKLYQIQDIFNNIGIQTKLVYVTEYDDRVCPKCIIYDYRINGISYDINDMGFVPRPPIHFRCRCRLLLKIGDKIISK